jgi:hypothetical protein
MDGLEAARVLRGARETKDIPSRQQPHFFVKVSEIVFGRRLVTLTLSARFAVWICSAIRELSTTKIIGGNRNYDYGYLGIVLRKSEEMECLAIYGAV